MAKINQNKLIGALIVGIITLIVVIVIVVVAKEIFPSNDRESSKTDLGTNTNSYTTTTTTPSVTTPSQNGSVTESSPTQGTSQTEDTTTTQSSVEMKTMYVQNYVYMRTGPGTENDIIETLSKGLEVQVVKLEDEWYEIVWNGITGYVYQSYLGEAPPPVTEPAVTTPAAE